MTTGIERRIAELEAQLAPGPEQRCAWLSWGTRAEIGIEQVLELAANCKSCRGSGLSP